jgi:hypothetical protein
LTTNQIFELPFTGSTQASQGDNNAQVIKDILSKLPIGGGDDRMSQGEQMQEQSKAYHVDPNNIAPPEVQRQLLDLLKWRDGVYRDVVKTIEMVPGLENLVDELSLALNACEEPVIIISIERSQLISLSKTCIRSSRLTLLCVFLKAPLSYLLAEAHTCSLSCNRRPQCWAKVVKLLSTPMTNMRYNCPANCKIVYATNFVKVFDNPSASDPTHSFLAKVLLAPT